MAFGVYQDSDPRAFRLVGELDLATCDQLINQLEPAMQAAGDLSLDLAALEFMDSTGISALIRVCRGLGDRGRVVLRSQTTEVAKVLWLVGAHTFPNLLIDPDGVPG